MSELFRRGKFIDFNELPENINIMLNELSPPIIRHLSCHSLDIWMYIFRQNNLPEEEINVAMMPFIFGIEDGK